MTRPDVFKQDALKLLKDAALHVNDHQMTDLIVLAFGDKDSSQVMTSEPITALVKLLCVFETIAYSLQPLLEDDSDFNHVLQRKCEALAAYFDKIS